MVHYEVVETYQNISARRFFIITNLYKSIHDSKTCALHKKIKETPFFGQKLSLNFYKRQAKNFDEQLDGEMLMPPLYSSDIAPFESNVFPRQSGMSWLSSTLILLRK